MAIISNFELLFKPIAPQGGPATEIARVVAQGYFLEVSNLESRDIILIFRTRTSIKQLTDSVNTEFTATNNSVVYDITQDNINIADDFMASYGPLIPNKQSGHFINCLPLPAGQTASIAVLPNIQQLLTSPGGPAFDLAIRGYTELVLAPDISNISPFTVSPPASARVLVSPEHRGSFIDPEFDFGNIGIQTDLDFDQLAYSLPTANGQALQELTTYADFDDPFLDLVTTTAISSLSNPLTLSSIGQNLPESATGPVRSTSFKLGSLPVKINYSIQRGKFVVDEDSLTNALTRAMKRKKILKTAKISPKTLAKKVNLALAGDKKVDAEIQKWIKTLKL